MGANLSTPEKLFQCVKKGEYHTLKAQLDRLQTTQEFRANPRAFLDAVDEDGNTPLIVASMRGHWQVAELLIQRGANVAAQNSRGDGGSALHEAVGRRQGHVVDLLLTHGASPFVENYKGHTAMDVASSTRNMETLRRIETYAQWSGWLSMKVTRLGGLGTEWQRRWVVVCPRLASPFAPPNKKSTHVVLLCYKSTSSCTPATKVWLDGATTTAVQNPRALERTGGRSPAQLELRLHRRLTKPPSGCFTTGIPGEGLILHFRPDEGTVHGCEGLRTFGEAVNNPRRAPAVPHPPPAGPTGVASTFQQQTGQQGHGGVLYTPPHHPGGDAHYSPLGQAVSGVVNVAANDAEIARRLQEEEDARLALQLSSMPSGGDNTTTNTNNATNMGSRPSAGLETRPSMPIPQPSQAAPGFYPAIRFNIPQPSNSNHPGGARPPQPERVMATAAPPPPSPFFSSSMLSGSMAPSAPESSLAQGPSGAAAAARVPDAPTVAQQQARAFEERVCIICFYNPIDTEFRHENRSCAAYCAECADRICREPPPKNICSLCRQEILSVARFHYG